MTHDPYNLDRSQSPAVLRVLCVDGMHNGITLVIVMIISG